MLMYFRTKRSRIPMHPEKKRPHSIRLLLILTGSILIAAGILRQEAAAIFMKAINVCFQCIGIG